MIVVSRKRVSEGGTGALDMVNLSPETSIILGRLGSSGAKDVDDCGVTAELVESTSSRCLFRRLVLFEGGEGSRDISPSKTTGDSEDFDNAGL